MNDVLLVVVVLVALGFDFTNGFHDTANAVATSVSTRALSPRLAVLIAADREPGRRVRHHCGRQDGRQGNHRHGPRQREDGAGRADRSDRLEPDHLAGRAALELVARADRRARRRGDRPVGPRRRRSGMGSCTAWRSRRSPRRRSPSPGPSSAAGDLLAARLDEPRDGEPDVPPRPARLGHLGRVHARRERRAEDDGRDRAGALRGRAPVALLHPDLGDRLRRPGDRGGHVRRRLADHEDARPARGQHGARQRLRGPDHRGDRRSTAPRSSATRSRRRT